MTDQNLPAKPPTIRPIDVARLYPTLRLNLARDEQCYFDFDGVH